jgi:hypothetical protein
LDRAANVLLGYAMVKDLRITCSNWAVQKLADEQIWYAAMDAWVPLRLFGALGLNHVPTAMSMTHTPAQPWAESLPAQVPPTGSTSSTAAPPAVSKPGRRILPERDQHQRILQEHLCSPKASQQYSLPEREVASATPRAGDHEGSTIAKKSSEGSSAGVDRAVAAQSVTGVACLEGSAPDGAAAKRNQGGSQDDVKRIPPRGQEFRYQLESLLIYNPLAFTGDHRFYQHIFLFQLLLLPAFPLSMYSLISLPIHIAVLLLWHFRYNTKTVRQNTLSQVRLISAYLVACIIRLAVAALGTMLKRR